MRRCRSPSPAKATNDPRPPPSRAARRRAHWSYPAATSEPSPALAHLPEALGAIGGVPLSRWTFDTDRRTDGAIARLLTELTHMWERAGLAGRGIFIEGRGIVLLYRGEELLRAGDARSTVADALRARTRRTDR